MNTSLSELYFGKKIQLEAYLKVCEKSLRLKPAGAYYLPIKGGYSDEKTSLQQKYKLKGNSLDSFYVAELSDKRFETENASASDIVEVVFKGKDDKREMASRSKVLSEKQMNFYGDYAIKLTEKACRDISALDITPSPLVIGNANPCERCPYFSFCRFDKNFGNISREYSGKITTENFGVDCQKNGEEDLMETDLEKEIKDKGEKNDSNR